MKTKATATYKKSLVQLEFVNRIVKFVFSSLQFLVVLEEFLAFMVLLNYIIPISMYVTVGESLFCSQLNL